jgi:DNA-binding NarL/FixJ family response regulator
MIAALELLELRNPINGVGLMIVDGSQRLVSANADAARILCYPAPPAETSLPGSALAARIPFLLDGRALLGPDGTTEFLSGRRHYRCRTLTLEPPPGGRLRPQTAILLQRGLPPRLPPSIPDQYGLTRREREVVELLMQGLTGKEIAERKQLSPNTIKAFFRLIMLKMGVKSRAAIVGRVFSAVSANPA